MKLSNAHTHTTFCDGRNSPWEMADTARALGFVSLGFSEHALENVGDHFGMKDEKGYIKTIRSLAKRFPDVRLWLGVELDAYAQCERASYDYIICALHNLVKDDECYAVDGRKEMLIRGIDRLFAGKGLEAARAYYKRFAEAVEQMHPDIVAHYDLITKNNAAGDLFDEGDPAYRRAALEGLDAVKASGALLEVNTGSMARGYLTRPYPDAFILKRWHEMGGRVILGSDCHDVRYITHGFRDAYSLLHEIGFESITRLGATGEEMFVEEALFLP